MNNFIKDDYFAKGHGVTKIIQTILSLIMWGGLFVPIVITFNSTVFSNLKNLIYRWKYPEGFLMFHYLTYELMLFLLVLCVIGVLLTLRNNHRIKHYYKRKITYNEQLVEKKEKLLQDFYQNNFDGREYRETISYFSVLSEKNIDDNAIADIFNQLEKKSLKINKNPE